jgi:alcohol dehydrogenase class IV
MDQKMNFEFATSQRIIFGNESTSQVLQIAATYGTRIILITGEHNKNDNPVCKDFSSRSDFKIKQIVCNREPSVDYIHMTLQTVKAFQPDLLIGIGGGSVIDTGKALAALASNDGILIDYLEVIGKGKPLADSPLPYIAIPTTAGTGSEVTRNAVIVDESRCVKVSLRSPLMIPLVAIIDPTLSVGLPPAITASTGMDALTQVIEPLITRKANPVTDALCFHAVSIARKALLKAYKDPADLEARETMSLVSLFGGLALANAGLGAVHGFAAAIGGMYPAIRHGEICAALLPAVMQINREAADSKKDYLWVKQKMDKLSGLFSYGKKITLDQKIRDIATKLNIPGLESLGVERSKSNLIIEKARNSSSMKGNPIALSDEELAKILELSL